MAEQVGYERVHIICRDVEDLKSIVPELQTFIKGFEPRSNVFKISEESRDWLMVDVGSDCSPIDSVLLGAKLAEMGFEQNGFTRLHVVRYVRKDAQGTNA